MKWNRILSATALGIPLFAGGMMASPAFAQHGGDHDGGGHGGFHGDFRGDFHGGGRHGFRHGFHDHRGGGIFFVPEWGCGWGFWGGCGYPDPYYPMPVVTEPQGPILYAEPDDNTTSVPGPPYYWYRCDKPSGYYPYIKECPDGWQQVVPQAPPPR